MKKLKLKVGMTYASRDGSEHTLITRLASPSDVIYRKTHPFVDSDGYAYMSDGRTHPKKDYPFDLIKEVDVTRRTRKNK